jgi:tripartite-type tricarboxylate transporter receptor subunit TctC
VQRRCSVVRCLFERGTGRSNAQLSDETDSRDRGICNPIKSFEPVVLMVRIPLVMFAHASVQGKDLGEVVSLLKTSPGKYRYATAGNGSPPHLTAELFKLKAGVDLLHVPYKGTGAAVPDVVAGQVHFMIDGPPPFLGHVKAGRLRALAAANEKRLEQLREVPTFAEQGHKGMEAGLWYAMLAPKGTPQHVINSMRPSTKRSGSRTCDGASRPPRWSR